MATPKPAAAIIVISFGPSPIASIASRSTPRCFARAFTALPLETSGEIMFIKSTRGNDGEVTQEKLKMPSKASQKLSISFFSVGSRAMAPSLIIRSLPIISGVIDHHCSGMEKIQMGFRRPVYMFGIIGIRGIKLYFHIMSVRPGDGLTD